jgi:hypothetical protein
MAGRLEKVITVDLVTNVPTDGGRKFKVGGMMGNTTQATLSPNQPQNLKELNG